MVSCAAFTEQKTLRSIAIISHVIRLSILLLRSRKKAAKLERNTRRARLNLIHLQIVHECTTAFSLKNFQFTSGGFWLEDGPTCDCNCFCAQDRCVPAADDPLYANLARLGHDLAAEPLAQLVEARAAATRRKSSPAAALIGRKRAEASECADCPLLSSRF